MKLSDALPMQRIRRPHWKPGHYWYFDRGGFLRDVEEGCDDAIWAIVHRDEINADDFEVAP